MRISDWSSDVCSSDLVSGEPQVSSVDKLDSGTGWPSFTKPLEPANVVENIDRSHRMTRTGVRSKHGDGHLDHLSPDGPRDKGDLRWRMNSASFRFIHRNQLESEGRSEEHTSELQSLMRISSAVFCLKKKHTKPPTKSKNK